MSKGVGEGVLHFLEEVSVGHGLEFLQDEVDAAADEEHLVFVHGLIQLQQVARTENTASTTHVEDDSHEEEEEELLFYFLLCCPNGNFSHKKFGSLSPRKPAAKELRYPTPTN